MSSKLLSLFALCALICSAAAHPKAYLSESRSTSYGGYAVLPIWTEDSGISYLVNVTIGSDNQTVPLIFDTGSPNTLLNPDCFTLTSDEAFIRCLDRPRYNAFTSTCSKFAGGSFSLSFGGGESQAVGTYVNDEIRIGDATVTAKHIGLVATSRNFDAGLFGAGRSAVGDAPSIIEQMVAQGQISSYAFSVDLGPLDSAEPGTVILGGIDIKRYKGALSMLEGNGFNTYLTGMGLTLPNGTHISYDSHLLTPNAPNTPSNSDTTPTGLPVFLDTASPYNLVPQSLLDVILKSYPATVSLEAVDEGTEFIVPCHIGRGTFDYTFASTTIHVPIIDTLSRRPSGQCVLPFATRPAHPHSGSVPFLLGTSVLRAAYVVFDVEGERVWVGERADCGSLVLTTGGGVPAVEGCGE